MAEPEFRLLGSALALGRFTNREIAEAAKVSTDTSWSWLTRRDGKLVERLPGTAAEAAHPVIGTLAPLRGKGRPASVVWQVRPGCEGEIRRTLDRLYPEALRRKDPDQALTAALQPLSRARDAIAAAARACDPEVAEVYRTKASAWVDATWDALADLARAELPIPDEMLNEIAAIERETGMLDQPAVGSLRGIAAWLAARTRRATDDGLPGPFIARILHAQAKQRSNADEAALAAASLAASLWAEEDEESCLAAAADYAESLPQEELLNRLGDALDTVKGICATPEEGEAILLGLVRRSKVRGSRRVRDWLSARRYSDDWDRCWAPALLYGLAEAPGIKLRAVLADLEGDVRRALESVHTPPRPRSFRAKVHDWCSRQLGSHENMHLSLIPGFGPPPCEDMDETDAAQKQASFIIHAFLGSARGAERAWL